MSIRFLRESRTASYTAGWSDPPTEVEVSCELRRDPLTGRSGRLAHFQGFSLVPPDLSEAISTSQSNCPFCPDRIKQVTPLLPARLAPSGRIICGEATLFPNISPYDRESVVVALTRAHYTALADFRPQQIGDGLRAANDFFRALGRPSAGVAALVTWNYMPPAGATQVHAHLQAFATDRGGSIWEAEVAASRSYQLEHQRSYWTDLIAAERDLGERMVASGPETSWVTAFVSRGVISDLMVVFPNFATLESLPEAAIDEFSIGLCAGLKELQQLGVRAFNLAFYSQPAGEAVDHFRLHCRLSPRVYLNPAIFGSDSTSWQQLLDEPFMVRSPEELATALKGPISAALLK